MQQNSIYCLCGDRDEMINHIISECSKSVQKELKIRHDRELSKKFKFDNRGDYPDYSIINISQNTVKSSKDLKRLAVTQTPVENHQLMLVGKTLKGIIIIIYIYIYILIMCFAISINCVQ